MPFGNSTPRSKGIKWGAPLESRRDSVLQPIGLRGTGYRGSPRAWLSTPTGLCPSFDAKAATPLGLLRCAGGSQGSSFLATLGFDAESRWDLDCEYPKGIEARTDSVNLHLSFRLPSYEFRVQAAAGAIRMVMHVLAVLSRGAGLNLVPCTIDGGCTSS